MVNIGRIVLVLIAFKHFGIVKYFMYFEVLNTLMESNLPLPRSDVDRTFYIVNLGMLNFVLDYFHFLPGLLCTLLQIFAFYVSHSLYNNAPVKVLSLVVDLFTEVVYLLVVHATITKVGFIIVKAQSLSEGNEQLLNNFDEGVIIMKKSG